LNLSTHLILSPGVRALNSPELSVCHLSPFQRAVLRITLEIPLGETRSYAWVAKRIGKPKAVRAVGQALRKNPYPLIIPCHRVIKSDGLPGKYAGKDDGRKKELIDLEANIKRQLQID